MSKMKITVLSLFTLVIFSFTFPPSVWKEFNNYEGKFHVLVPTGEMVHKVSKMKTEIGEMNYHQYIYQPTEKPLDNVFYLVNYCDYPKGTFPKDSTELIQEFLDSTVAESVESVKGKLTYQSDIQLLMSKGKVWRVQYNNEKVSVKNKCFIAGDRFYLLQVMTLKEHFLNTGIDKFLDSFYMF
jgi:hypothetical protein